MLTWFYNGPTNTKVSVANTQFNIADVDLSTTYIGLGTNSKISVSNNHTIDYYVLSEGKITSIGNLFELNLPVFKSGAVINTDFKILPTNNHSGLLIQVLKSTTISFNYNIDCSFAMIGGGGGGGLGSYGSGNAGGGGGAGELVTGKITGFQPTNGNYLNIVIGDGGKGATNNPSDSAGNQGGITRIQYLTSTSTVIGDISANGGGGGGSGKSSSSNMIGSSSGGTGSYSSGVPTVGTATTRNPISTVNIFNTMTSYNNRGLIGQDNNSDNGAGGSGGGAGGNAAAVSNQTYYSVGGSGRTVKFGNTDIVLGGGGGGGASLGGTGGLGGSGGGGKGGDDGASGSAGTDNTGGGGGGGSNRSGNGGKGGSGTVILYILPQGVS